MGVPAGPAPVDAPGLRRHPRPGRRPHQLRRHHLRQGRRDPQAAGRLRRARAVRRGSAHLLRHVRVGQHPVRRPADGARGRVGSRPRSVVGAVAEDRGCQHAQARRDHRHRRGHHVGGRLADRDRRLPHPATAPDRDRPLRPRGRHAGPGRSARAGRRRPTHRGARAGRSRPAGRAAAERRRLHVREAAFRRPLVCDAAGAYGRLRREPPRSLVIGAFWEMVREGEMPAATSSTCCSPRWRRRPTRRSSGRSSRRPSRSRRSC